MPTVSRRSLHALAALGWILAITTCSDNTEPSRAPASYITPTGLETSTPPQIFVGAGDIADCGATKTGDSQTAALLDGIPGEVFVLGDNVYPNGTTSEYTNCYEPTWGRHKARTHPTPGNHDYNTAGGAGYFSYFGAAAGTQGQGYYSFDLGAWHIIVLNDEILKAVGSPQHNWLKADLAAHPNQCTLAYWHYPLYSSIDGAGSGGATVSSVRPFWDLLYAAGAELVLNGHRHVYERLAPMKPDGTLNSTSGILQIIAGTGGEGGGSNLTNVHPASRVLNGTTFGVLKLYLYDDSAAWKFVPVAGKTFTDSGSVACHPPPQSGAPVATALGFTVEPGNTEAGGTITPAVKVEIRDQFGARLTSGSQDVTLAIGTNPAGGTLAGTRTVAAVNGVASFSNLSIDRAGSGYRLAASSSGLTGATSGAFDITAPATPVATALGFTVEPGNTEAGATITPAVKVEIRDQFGARVTSASQDVTLAIGTNPAGGTLAGTRTVAAVNGVASFDDLSIDEAGSGYTLAASSSGLTGATSGAFNITTTQASVATALAFTVEPGTTGAGATITPAVKVEIRDQSGARVTSAIQDVTLAIGTNPAGGTLAGTRTVAAVNGVASFGNLSIDEAGTGYTLVASSDGLTGATSGAFNITSSGGSTVSPARSTATVPPQGRAGDAVALTVQARDQDGNPISTGGAAVTIGVTGANSATPTVTDRGDGTYTATYTPRRLGTDNVAITLNGSPIGGSPFTRTVVARVNILSGNNQTAPAGTAVPGVVSVKTTDGFGAAAPGIRITFVVTSASGGGSVTGAVQTSNASGVATLGSWTLGRTPGINRIRATVTGSSIFVTFTATGQ